MPQHKGDNRSNGPSGSSQKLELERRRFLRENGPSDIKYRPGMNLFRDCRGLVGRREQEAKEREQRRMEIQLEEALCTDWETNYFPRYSSAYSQKKFTVD